MSIQRHVIGAAALALFGASVVGLATREDPAPPVAAVPGEVRIAGFAFVPDPLEIPVGTTITWTNDDNADHTVDSDGGAELASGSIKKGESFSHEFATAGTFQYLCAFHPYMKGTVEVTG